jgi:triosephosphate isomerase
MRKKIIAGNWKMNKDIPATEALLSDLKLKLIGTHKAGVIICPPFTSLALARAAVRDTAIRLGAQNVSEQSDGAYTGEISVSMLVAAGCEYVIVGHSERRQYYHETDVLVNAKARKALEAGLNPIICVGETLAEREGNVTEKVVTTQVEGVLQGIDETQFAKCIIAYEPVWAIGTGKTATPQQANDVHKLIRGLVAKKYSQKAADNIVIQYGGSVNDKNAAELLSQPDIDGALVGGASLKADAFAAIVGAV